MPTPRDSFKAKNSPRGGLLIVEVRTVRSKPPHCEVAYGATPVKYEVEITNRTGYDVDLAGVAEVVLGDTWIGIGTTPGDSAAGHIARRDLVTPGYTVPDQPGRKPPVVAVNSNIAALKPPPANQPKIRCHVETSLDVEIGLFSYKEQGSVQLELDVIP